MFKLVTDYPIAYTSPDHLYPQGTKNSKGGPNYSWENGFNPYVDEVVKYFNKSNLKVLDLGAASGYLTLDFIKKGCMAVGLEGSDWPLQNKVDNWKHYHNKNLFTCDIGKPFSLYYNNDPVQFDLINAWEVAEHLPPDELYTFTENIHRHLTEDGIFVCSISPWFEPSIHNPNINLHLSYDLNKKQDWEKVFSKFKFVGPITGESDCGFHYLFSNRYRGKVREAEGGRHTFWSTMRKK